MPSTRTLRLAAVLAASALTLAACGSDDSSDTDDTAATSTAAATTAADSPTTAAASAAFPVTIVHAFGETVIATEPTRVVAWGWGSADAAIALGVVPVAIPFQDYGGDDAGVLPWIRQALDEQGAATPSILPNSEEVPFEAIAEAQPDLILAAYSGITAEDYELLAAIAPTVAYPGEAWSTPWRDLIGIVGTALGRSTEADAVLEEIDGAIAAQAAAHPELAGKSIAAVWDTGDTFYVYKPADPRVEFTLDLGMVSADSVDALSTDESTFYFTLSFERLSELTSDILVNYADTPEQSQKFLTATYAQVMPQVQSGAVAEVTGEDFVASVSPPTALSLTWGLEDYVELLAGAAAKADAAG